MTKPLTPANKDTPPDQEGTKNMVITLFTALGFFMPGAFNLNYSTMFVMAILTFIVCVLYIFPPDDEV